MHAQTLRDSLESLGFLLAGVLTLHDIYNVYTYITYYFNSIYIRIMHAQTLRDSLESLGFLLAGVLTLSLIFGLVAVDVFGTLCGPPPPGRHNRRKNDFKRFKMIFKRPRRRRRPRHPLRSPAPDDPIANI